MDDKILKAIARIVEIYDLIENDLLRILASHFKVNGEFLNSDYWRIQKLQELGLFNEEVIEYLAKYSKTTKEEIIKALNDIKVDTMDIPKLRTAFKDGRLKVNPEVLLNNPIIKVIVENQINELTGRFINISERIKDSLRETYLDIVEKAYLETASGAKSYEETIREVINKLGDRGITTLSYNLENGNIRNYDIEGTARREILNGVRDLNAKITEEIIKETNPEYIYLSEHLDCRPTHFDWQGTVIKAEDLTKPLPEFPEYGSVVGIKGVNCRHYFEPFFGDPSKVKKQYTQEECDEQYRLSQKQRYYERGVRAWKRKLNLAKGSQDEKEIKHIKYKENFWRKRLNNFVKDNNLQRDYSREYIYK